MRHVSPALLLLLGLVCVVALWGCGQNLQTPSQDGFGNNVVVSNGPTPDQSTSGPTSDTPAVTVEGKPPPPPPPVVPTPERIAFARSVTVKGKTTTQAIHTMWTNGTDVKQLTTSAYYAYGPTWSPDGQKICYTCQRTNLYTMNNDGTDQQLLLSSLIDNNKTEWADWGHNAGSPEIAYADDSMILLYPNPVEPPGLPRLTDMSYHSPTWSPDGQVLAMAGKSSSVTPPDTTWSIYVLAKPFTFLTEPIYYGDPYRIQVLTPGWQPDWCRADDNGLSKLAYSWGGDLFTVEVYTATGMVVDGASPVQLTNTPTLTEEQPSWSPDGTRLAFQEGGHIKTLDIAAGVTTDLGVGTNPAWSPSVF